MEIRVFAIIGYKRLRLISLSPKWWGQYVLCRIYTFARVVRRMMSVPITYPPRHSLRHLPHHMWRSLWKRFFEHESKGTNGNVRYVYEHVNVRTHVKTVLSHRDRGIRMFVKWRGEARHEHECVNVVLVTQQILRTTFGGEDSEAWFWVLYRVGHKKCTNL